MAFKVLVAFVWTLVTAFVVCGILTVAHSQLDIFSKVLLYIVGVFAETFVSCLCVEGLGI